MIIIYEEILSYPLDSLVSAECDDGVMCCSAIDDAGKHTRLLVWGLRRPPAPATCPAPCPGERYTAASASTVPRDSTFSQTHHYKEHLFSYRHSRTHCTQYQRSTPYQITLNEIHCAAIWNNARYTVSNGNCEQCCVT